MLKEVYEHKCFSRTQVFEDSKRVEQRPKQMHALDDHVPKKWAKRIKQLVNLSAKIVVWVQTVAKLTGIDRKSIRQIFHKTFYIKIIQIP